MLRRRVLVMLLGGALVAACNSPSLPLPPPLQPTQSASSDGNPGKVHLDGQGAIPGALLITYNPTQPLERRVAGVEVAPSGTWALDVWASKGEVVEVWQELDSTKSSSFSVLIK